MPYLHPSRSPSPSPSQSLSSSPSPFLSPSASLSLSLSGSILSSSSTAPALLILALVCDCCHQFGCYILLRCLATSLEMVTMITAAKQAFCITGAVLPSAEVVKFSKYSLVFSAFTHSPLPPVLLWLLLVMARRLYRLAIPCLESQTTFC